MPGNGGCSTNPTVLENVRLVHHLGYLGMVVKWRPNMQNNDSLSNLMFDLLYLRELIKFKHIQVN